MEVFTQWYKQVEAIRRYVLSYFSKKEIKSCRGINFFTIAPPTFAICSQRPRCASKHNMDLNARE